MLRSICDLYDICETRVLEKTQVESWDLDEFWVIFTRSVYPVPWPYGATGFATAHVFGSDGSEFSGGGGLDLPDLDLLMMNYLLPW